MTAPRIPCSVVVLTLNEERNIGACLESVASFDECYVLDSGSTDATLKIAARLGAAAASNAFASFGQQRNWAHDNLPLRQSWVLHLDADERMTTALANEIGTVIAADTGKLAGYHIAERTLLRGGWLRHAGQYPRYQARLVHRGRMKFVDHGHGQRESSNLPFGTLANPYDHLAFSHGLEHWLRKHAGYASKEAAQILASTASDEPVLSQLFSANAMERRRALKQLAMRVPMRPLLRFLHVLVVNRGILDGRAGWEYARMMRVFQEMIDLALAEARHEQSAEAALALRAGGAGVAESKR
ncbi:MAG: glycosyltransferase family 2 protein [Gammaproteobacteria bacterium]